MYPRNAASPERIAIGAVVQISDGAVQTSGVTITVRGQGGAEGTGSGTTAYGASGIVYYTPTQGETDFTSFVVIASKTGCIPVAQTIITSASATAGYGGVDWGKVTNATSTVNLSGTTVKTATDVETDTADIQSKIGTPAGASIAADIAAIEAQTDDIGASGAGLTAVPWNPAWDAEVQSEVDDALVALNLDHLVKIAVDTDFATTVHLDSVIGQLADNGTTATFDRTTDSLEALQGAVDTVDNYIDSEVSAIKAKTDQLTFTTANQVDATTVTVSTGAIGTGDIASAALNEIADAILDRNMATGTDSGSTTVRTPRQALRVMRNKVAIAAGTATVYKEDDSTSSWTAAVTTTAGDPISAVDPAGP